MPRRSIRYINVVDVESTCWDGDVPEGQQTDIIEIGIVRVDTFNRTVGQAFKSKLVLPMSSVVGDFCTELTGITAEEVSSGGVSLGEACTWLREEWKSHKIPWASWGDYDRVQFQRCCSRDGVPYPFGRSHLNIKNLHAMMRGNSYSKGMKYALEDLGMVLKGQHHRADSDAHNIARILTTLLRGHPVDESDDLYRGHTIKYDDHP